MENGGEGIDMDVFWAAILGQAMGGAIWVIAGGIGLTALWKKVLRSRLASVLGLFSAGLILAVVNAFGHGEDGNPSWPMGIFGFALPCGIAAVYFFVAWLLGRSQAEKAESSLVSTGGFLIAICAMVPGMYLATTETRFSRFEVSMKFEDPELTQGLEALKEHHPNLFASLMDELNLSDQNMGGTEGARRVYREFLDKHRSEFFRSADDRSIRDTMQLGLDMAQYLAAANPSACVLVGQGRPPNNIPDLLSYDLKIREAAALKSLIESAGQESSGIAGRAEVEDFLLGTFERFVAEDPKGYATFVAMSDSTQEYTSDECDAIISYSRAYLQASDSELSRAIRSSALTDPNFALSPENEARSIAISLSASAAVENASMPQKYDEITTGTAVTFEDPRMIYDYRLDLDQLNRFQMKAWFEEAVLPEVCADQDIAPLIGAGYIYVYRYTSASGRSTLPFEIDASACESGALSP